MTPKERRDKAMKLGVILGAGLAIVCYALPPEHRTICNLVAKSISLSCGVPL